MSRQERPRKKLRERLAWPSVLYQAFAEVTKGANPDSAGPDGVTINAFCRSAKAEISLLRAEIKNGKYSPSLGRGVAIAKKPGQLNPKTVRPITVFNVRDRIVQRAISNLIWPHLRDAVVSEVSFGGIRSYAVNGVKKSCAHARKNVHAAALRIMTLRRDGYGYTFETDIQRFFPSIKKDVLRQQLRERLPDNSLDDLIDASIETNVSNYATLEARGLSECWDPRFGVPQGGVLSPLLANYYLAGFDRQMIAAGFLMVRYVDDLVVLTESRSEALRAFATCKKLVRELGLTIHELDEINEKGKIKTRIVGQNQSFDFLGLTFNKRSIQPSPTKLADLQDRVRQITHAWNGRKTLVEVIIALNRLLRGWMAAYSLCDIPSQLTSSVDHIARSGLASWMLQHGVIRSRNAITPEIQGKLGLWSATRAEIRPISSGLSVLI